MVVETEKPHDVPGEPLVRSAPSAGLRTRPAMGIPALGAETSQFKK